MSFFYSILPDFGVINRVFYGLSFPSKDSFPCVVSLCFASRLRSVAWRRWEELGGGGVQRGAQAYDVTERGQDLRNCVYGWHGSGLLFM